MADERRPSRDGVFSGDRSDRSFDEQPPIIIQINPTEESQSIRDRAPHRRRARVNDGYDTPPLDPPVVIIGGEQTRRHRRRRQPTQHTYIPPTSSFSGDSRTGSRSPIGYGHGHDPLPAQIAPGTPWPQPPNWAAQPHIPQVHSGHPQIIQIPPIQSQNFNSSSFSGDLRTPQLHAPFSIQHPSWSPAAQHTYPPFTQPILGSGAQAHYPPFAQPILGVNQAGYPSFTQNFAQASYPPFIYSGTVPQAPYLAQHEPHSHGAESLYAEQPPIIIEGSDKGDQTSVYVAVDPFRPSGSSIMNSTLPVSNDQEAYPYNYTAPYVVYPYSRRRSVFKALLIDMFAFAWIFVFDTIPRQLYLHFLLRLPSFYFSRVARIFEEADMTMPEIKKMALANVRRGIDPLGWSTHASPLNANLKMTWEGFIESLLREWKTLNIVSVLLLSAILTILQIESAAADPITRNTALFSLICALMSLLYGCMYIIRFGTMRKTYKAAEWAQEAQKTRTLIWWNVWVLLAMPAVWLAWSIILYIACIMAFVWRTGTTGRDSILLLSPGAELGIRIAISAILALGVIYFTLILNTLRRYGDAMDKSFKARVDAWAKERYQDYQPRPHHVWPPAENYPPSFIGNSYGNPGHYPHSVSRSSVGTTTSNQDSTLYPSPSSTVFESVKIMDLRFQNRGGSAMPDFLMKRGFKHEDWERFISEESLAWDGDAPLHHRKRLGRSWEAPLRPQDSAAGLLEKWNRTYFIPRGTMALLCQEYTSTFPHSPTFAIYLMDFTFPDGQPFTLADRFGPVPEGLERIDIFDQPDWDNSRKRILGRTSIYSNQNPMEGRVHWGYGGAPDRRSRSRSRSRASSRDTAWAYGAGYPPPGTPYQRTRLSSGSRSSRSRSSSPSPITPRLKSPDSTVLGILHPPVPRSPPVPYPRDERQDAPTSRSTMPSFKSMSPPRSRSPSRPPPEDLPPARSVKVEADDSDDHQPIQLYMPARTEPQAPVFDERGVRLPVADHGVRGSQRRSRGSAVRELRDPVPPRTLSAVSIDGLENFLPRPVSQGAERPVRTSTMIAEQGVGDEQAAKEPPRSFDTALRPSTGESSSSPSNIRGRVAVHGPWLNDQSSLRTLLSPSLVIPQS